MLNGVDISSHNGKINFNQLKNTNIKVVIIKATEGTNYIDSKLNEYYNQAKDKFYIGFYHFMSEKTDPKLQAIDFYNAIKNKQYQILPTLDIETNNKNRSKKEISDRCIQFLNKFKELSGLDCMIYTGGYFGKDLLDDRVKQYPGWIAHYGVSKPMNNGFTIIGHQYTENGKVKGINTNCDLNYFSEKILIKNYRISQLQKIIKVSDDGIWGSVTDTACKKILIKINANNNIELVKWIQSRLGCNTDGVFGKNTELSLKKWQQNHGLIVDGIAGYNSIKSLALE